MLLEKYYCISAAWEGLLAPLPCSVAGPGPGTADGAGDAPSPLEWRGPRCPWLLGLEEQGFHWCPAPSHICLGGERGVAGRAGLQRDPRLLLDQSPLPFPSAQL